MDVFIVIFVLVIIGFFIFIISRIAKMFKRRKALNDAMDQLKTEGYKFTEEYNSAEFHEKMAYDLKKETLLYLAFEEPPQKIPFRKLKDVTILMDGEEQSQFRMSANDTRSMSDEDWKYWIDTMNRDRDFKTVQLKIELEGFIIDHIAPNFVYHPPSGEDEPIETHISGELIRWFKVIRKLIEKHNG